MIEASDTASGLEPADVVAGWMAQVQQLASDCADDVQRINLLSALEAMKGCAAGGQATVTVGFAATPDRGRAAGETGPEVIRRSVAGQVALARRDAQHRGGRHVGLAVALHTELPHTRRALEDGRISEWQATLICRETACLDPDLRRLADERLAPDLGRWVTGAGTARRQDHRRAGRRRGGRPRPQSRQGPAGDGAAGAGHHGVSDRAAPGVGRDRRVSRR